ncbi:class I adenylate cyclase [Desulfobacula phenolica]|uniref:Adenylate cyclase, class 1 n=1 Tax=Desulfobacula phenolica TaxID=90732 RepID=A0A1H2ISI1_9BACT|nr:class I adenylate cyclase [Desulfobacula phenolica]SDU46808.1 adenylate cyclase, class 1 [Desulfobacula phenolica]
MESSATYFDVENFEAQWEHSNEKQKVQIIKQSRYFNPSIVIVPVLAGFFSNSVLIRNYAVTNLEFLLKKIGILLSDQASPSRYKEGMKESALVSARIYARMSPETPSKELNSFFKILLELGGKGPSFAFKALYKGYINFNSMEKSIADVSETDRFAFVDQYLQARPSVRLKYGEAFKNILNSITSRSSVVEFYASLFDRHQDADPFLQNIQIPLRNPKTIMEKEMVSKESTKKIQGLKALSMLLNRVPSKILLVYLNPEEKIDVRIAIYNIVENSSIGTYSDLFDSILKLFAQSKADETMHAFKAMVATGKLPIYKLLEKVKELYPSLLPVIKNEISTLSKMSFLFIQDIALNKEHYTKGVNLDINLACVFGMIKKRPERMVGIFQKAATDSKDISKTEVIRFVNKIKTLLSNEKKNMESDFLQVISTVSNEKQTLNNKRLFHKFFKDPVEKKLGILKQNISSKSIDFQGGKISFQNLSEKIFKSSPIFFNKSTIQNCDLSDACFSFAFFNSCVIYDVDMRNTTFENVSFDNAVLINVDAEGAVFKNCSFHAASIFNSNFNNAKIKDGIFIEAVISKSFFNNTDLSYSCFAYSKISWVSFSTANINQVDFSGVKARFSRFPHSNRTVTTTEAIDYNARKYQLTFEDIPQINDTILSQINLLIFCEFTHYGELKFLKQNKLSLLTAYDIFKPKQADLFRIIPILIHENIDFPLLDIVPEQTPCGISDYVPSLEAQSVCTSYMNNAKLIVRRHSEPAIQGLFTIGSVGSIAQTSESDIDYWVCIQESVLTPAQIKLLEKKLLMLEKMAWDKFNIQVTFFIVDVTKVKNNDFGDSTIESSGSAQAGLLKEEFYRTMIYLAGKIPLWSVLPTAVSLNYYADIGGKISTNDPQDRYVDLGDIHEISPGEYFGASIWQMFKWLKSPFKSVIKMALLEKYIFDSGQELLLCNRYKNEWMNTGSYLRLAQNDSYYFLMKHLVAFYQKIDDKHSVNLLLTCFFLKLGVAKKNQIENTVFGLRKILFLKCMDTWNWDINKIFEVGNFRKWPYKNIVRLSNSLEKYILQKYKKVKKSFEHNIRESSMISHEDRTVLEHKVKIEFSDQPMKVRKILLVSRSDRHFYGLYLKFINNDSSNGEWLLFNKNPKALHDNEETLIRAKTIEEIGAWLIVNGLYSKNTIINLVPNPCYVTFDEIKNLYENIHDFFYPLIKSAVGFDQLLAYPNKKALFVSVNFYVPEKQKKIIHYTALYVNDWNEVFCKSFFADQGFISIAHVKRDLMFKLRTNKLPSKTVFYFSKGIEK